MKPSAGLCRRSVQAQSAGVLLRSLLVSADGIVIALPQRDVHLDTAPPVHVRLLDDEPE
jgi:hypothetical protein